MDKIVEVKVGCRTIEIKEIDEEGEKKDKRGLFILLQGRQKFKSKTNEGNGSNLDYLKLREDNCSYNLYNPLSIAELSCCLNKRY